MQKTLQLAKRIVAVYTSTAARHSILMLAVAFCGMCNIYCNSEPEENYEIPDYEGPIFLDVDLVWFIGVDLDVDVNPPGEGSQSCFLLFDDTGSTGEGRHVESWLCTDAPSGLYELTVANRSSEAVNYELSVSVDGSAPSGYPVERSVAGNASNMHTFTIQ